MGRVFCSCERPKFEIIRFSLIVLWYDVSVGVFRLVLVFTYCTVEGFTHVDGIGYGGGGGLHLPILHM